MQFSKTCYWRKYSKIIKFRNEESKVQSQCGLNQGLAFLEVGVLVSGGSEKTRSYGGWQFEAAVGLGIKACRCTGMQVYMCAGVHVCRCAGIQVCRYAGVGWAQDLCRQRAQ